MVVKEIAANRSGREKTRNLVLFGEVSSSSVCLGWATLFYCGTP